MQAVVLAGGRGERLAPLTARVPKPLVPILGRPLLGYLLDHLESRGVTEVFVTAGYLGRQVAEFVAAEPGALAVHVVQEPSVRGTAGAVADLLPRLRSPFLVVSGDVVLDLDLETLRAAHRRARAVATIATAVPGERLRFGVIAARGEAVEAFHEKPSLRDLLPGLAISSGCYLLDREALAGVAGRGPVDFARDVFPQLLAGGGRIAVSAGLGYWRDIGTPDAYREIHLEAVARTWPWATGRRERPARLGRDVELVEPVAFGRGVRIESGARLIGPLYLGDGVAVGRAATVERSVVLAGGHVGTRAELRDAVVDEGLVVPPGLAVRGAFVGRASERATPAARPVPA